MSLLLPGKRARSGSRQSERPGVHDPPVYDEVRPCGDVSLKPGETAARPGISGHYTTAPGSPLALTGAGLEGSPGGVSAPRPLHLLQRLLAWSAAPAGRGRARAVRR